MTADYQTFIARRLAAGDDPNMIIRQIEEELKAVAKDWNLWGDGEWRTDTVCPECGSAVAGVCGHHREPILRRLYEAKL